MERGLDLSVVIVSFNTSELTVNCIKSVIAKTKGLQYEIVVVDNGSKDGSVKEVKHLIAGGKNITVIENTKNKGFATANNQGWRVAKGKYILFLNSDTKISSNVLGDMVGWMDVQPGVGVSACALKSKNGKLQASGGYFPSLPRVIAWMLFFDDLPVLGRLIKSFHPHTPDFFGNNQDYLKKHEQDWVTGAFLLTRREILEKVKGWDESYFMYVEEVDLCYRIKKLGYQIWYLPKWSIVHFGGASSKVTGYSLIAEFTSIKKFYKKFYAAWEYPLLRLLLKIGALGRIVLFTILKGKEEGLIYAKAFREA